MRSPLRPLPLPLAQLKPPVPHRPFLTSSSTPQSYAATRTLPYARTQLFALIADIDSYASFLPYCQRSHTTAWCAGLPTAATLVLGWRGLEEGFASDVRCVPGESVLAVAQAGGLFRALEARWALRDASGGTEVALRVEMCFANEFVAALSRAAVPRVAAAVVEAFERRAREVLGGGEAG